MVGGETVSTVESLDVSQPDTQWESLQPMKIPRESVCVATMRSKIYVWGGLSDDNVALTSGEVYDIEARSWSNLPHMEVGRYGCDAVPVRARFMFVVGGRRSEDTTTSTIEVYDTIAKRFIKGVYGNPRLCRARFMHKAGVVGNRLVVVGGDDVNEDDDIRTTIESISVDDFFSAMGVVDATGSFVWR